MAAVEIWSAQKRLWMHQLLGLLVRGALLLYGQHQDAHSSLQYTDVDYHVITDAAGSVSRGGSPFDRATYRYTPFLSWLMLPNVLCHAVFGKVLFCLLDTVATHIIYCTVQRLGYDKVNAVKCSLLWLYNPIVIGISTRGSAESVIVTLVLIVLYFHANNNPTLSGIFLGVSIHFKLYPIIYSLPLYLSLESGCFKNLWLHFAPTLPRIKFTAALIVTFIALTSFGYFLYGYDYIQEGFLYHFTRVDTRHNFSIYFYLLYLSVNYNIPGLGLATFVPQFVLVIAYGFVYGTREHIVLSMFAQTVVFVTFNKVVTSQYFLWYLVFIPLLCCQLQVSKRKGVLLSSLWVLAQAAWLLPAYLFEFRGMNVFVPIWLESVAFFCCSVGVLMVVLSSYWARQVALKLK